MSQTVTCTQCGAVNPEDARPSARGRQGTFHGDRVNQFGVTEDCGPLYTRRWLKCTYCQDTDESVRVEHSFVSYNPASQVTVSGVLLKVTGKAPDALRHQEPTPTCGRCAREFAHQALMAGVTV